MRGRPTSRPAAYFPGMESANTQTLRHLEELFNRRDLDAYVQRLAPQVEWHVAREDPDTTVHRGRDAVRGYLEHWIEVFSDLRLDIEDARAAGDKVLTVLRLRGSGTGSSAPFDQQLSTVFSFIDGHVSKVEEFFDHDEARRAAGLDQASTK